MIPPFLAAAIAKPGIKWGAIGGIVLALLVSTNWWTYDRMRTKCEESKMEAVLAQAQQSAKQALKGAEMAADVSGDADHHAEILRQRIIALERKDIPHGKSRTPCTIEPGIVQRLDEYARLLNSTPHSLPPSDGGAGQREVQGGGLDPAIPQVVQVKSDSDGGEAVSLTPEEFNRYMADVSIVFGRGKVKHKGLSDFDDERLKLQRQAFEQKD